MAFFFCCHYYLNSIYFFFSSRRRHTRLQGDWSSDVCSSDLSPRRRSALTITDRPEDSLAAHGLRAEGRVLRNPTTSQLYTAALDRGEAVLAEDGPLVVDTGRFTGRSPKDKFVVHEPGSEERIWWSDTNAEISEE